MTRVLRPVVLAGLAIALAGCSVGASIPGMSMMGGTGQRHMAADGSTMPGRQASTTCAVPTDLPGTTVHVAVTDMRMGGAMMGPASTAARMMLRAVPAVVPAGSVSFVVTNMGRRTHELVVLPLADGVAAGSRTSSAQGQVDEQGSLGEASRSCGPGTGDGIEPGTSGWVTLTLAPGEYELLCNEPNHYADGMWQRLTVR